MSIVLYQHFGAFSHINTALLDEMRKQNGGLRFETIDARAAIVSNKVTFSQATAHALAAYPDILVGQRKPGPALFRTPFAWRHLTRAATSPARPLFTIQSQALFNGKISGVPHFLYTDHTHLANLTYPRFARRDLYSATWIALERSAYLAADAVFCMSEHVRRSLIADYGVNTARVFNIGVGRNAAAAANHERTAEPGRHVIFVGVDWERKGGPELVTALEQVRRTLPDVRLSVVGCSPALTQSWIEVVGRVPLDDVSRRLAEADLFCMPTHIEPFGIAVIEAMAAGLPVLMPALGAFPDFVRPGINGDLFAPNDRDALAAKLHDLLATPARLPDLGAQARADVADRFTWATVAARLNAGIEAALAAA